MNYLNKPNPGKPWPQQILCIGTNGKSRETFRWYAGLYRPMGNTGWRSIDAWHGTVDNFTVALHRLSQQAKALVIIEHAYEILTLGKFWDELSYGGLQLRGWDERDGGAPRCIVESPPTIVHYSAPNGSVCVICDSANFGFKPFADTANTARFESSEIGMEEHLREYVQAYQSLVSQAGLGNKWSCTAASQAWHGWRLTYMQTKIEIPDGSPDELFLPKATYGGRCECFHLGEHYPHNGIWHLDANQLYSAAAAIAQVPLRLVRECRDEQLDPKAAFNCMASVRIKTPAALYPFRPKDESEYGRDIVVYPTGEFDTALCGPELMQAVTCGHIVKVHKAWQYDCDHVLREWANRMWQLRQHGGRKGDIAKRIAVGLYGKFAAKHREWKAIPDDCCPPFEDMEVGDWYAMGETGIQRFRTLAGRSMVEVTDGWEQMSSPHVNSWITSMGRVLLNQFLVSACGHVYYCDTDSVWVDEIGLASLQDDKLIHDGLGGLRIVAHHDEVNFIGIRAYIADGELHAAGVPDGAVVNDMHTHAEWSRTPSFNECMANREWPAAKVIHGKHRLHRPYQHGEVQADGSVRPFNIHASQVPEHLGKQRLS